MSVTLAETTAMVKWGQKTDCRREKREVQTSYSSSSLRKKGVRYHGTQMKM